MKFPRNARIFRGQFDAAPFASVFFLLVIFALVGSLVYTPGVRLRLPRAGGWAGTNALPGVDGPTISVALVTNQYYFQNQIIRESDLKERLETAAQASSQPLTLVVLADKDVTDENLVRLAMLARDAKIYDLLLATLPRPFDTVPAILPRNAKTKLEN